GSHGIGLAIALALADEGVNVAICSRTEERLQAAQTELYKKGVKVLALTCDVFDASDINSVCEKIIKEWGVIHILINNVGGGGSWGDKDITKTKDEVWFQVYEKNALAAARFTVQVLPGMKKEQWGRVIAIASKYGKEGGGRPWFTMAKSAEIAL